MPVLPSVGAVYDRTAEWCQEISQGYAFFAYPWNSYRGLRSLPLAKPPAFPDTPPACAALA